MSPGGLFPGPDGKQTPAMHLEFCPHGVALLPVPQPAPFNAPGKQAPPTQTEPSGQGELVLPQTVAASTTSTQLPSMHSEFWGHGAFIAPQFASGGAIPTHTPLAQNEDSGQGSPVLPQFPNGSSTATQPPFRQILPWEHVVPAGPPAQEPKYRTQAPPTQCCPTAQGPPVLPQTPVTGRRLHWPSTHRSVALHGLPRSPQS